MVSYLGRCALAASVIVSSVTAFPTLKLETPDQFSKWSPTDPKNMAPCPFTNAFANHGLIPRTGITSDDIKAALAAFQMDSVMQSVFSGPSIMNLGSTVNGTQVLTLSQLDKHGAIEHDASLTRQDNALGDNTKFDSKLYAQLRALSTDGQYITEGQLAEFRRMREADSRSRNAQFSFGFKEKLTAYGEAALILITMRDDTGKIRLDWLDMLMQQEKLPFELGWKLRSITMAETLVVAGRLLGKVVFALDSSET
jgi:hypothetical protein